MIRILKVDDYIVVFNDRGEPVWDDHSCPLTIGLEVLDIPFESLYMDSEDEFEAEDIINSVRCAPMTDEKWKALSERFA